MYHDIYRSAAEDNVREMRKRAQEHRLYRQTKKERKPRARKKLFGTAIGFKENAG